MAERGTFLQIGNWRITGWPATLMFIGIVYAVTLIPIAVILWMTPL